MSNDQWKIEVSNPSPYVRSDYAEVDLESLDVDEALDSRSLRLLLHDGGSPKEVSFQIDHVMGELHRKRIMTFLAENLPSRTDDYREASATYCLEKVKPSKALSPQKDDSLSIDYYYDPCDISLGDHVGDGFNSTWDPERSVYGVKMRNNNLEIYISLKTHSKSQTSMNYVGSVASVLVQKAPRTLSNPINPDNFLSPFQEHEGKYWGMVKKLAIYPPPWEMSWYHDVSLLDTEYQLINANCGPMRATVTLQSKTFPLRFANKPPFSGDTIEIMCSLYRIISIYPDKPYYMEELFILSEDGYPISCRPYYISNIHFHPSVYSSFARIENIPDYFALWRHFGNTHYGYGFASNSHVRQLELGDSEIGWRLQLDFHHKSIHYFIFNAILDYTEKQDIYHDIGHFGWYEQLYKPVAAMPVQPLQLAKRYEFRGGAK
jgi:hypothetical protein